MGLYDRNRALNSVENAQNMQNSQNADFGASYDDFRTENVATSSRSVFIKQTYQLLAASLLAATAGAYIGTYVVKSFSWMLLILELGLLFGLFMSKKNPTLALVMLFGFTFVSGLTLGPVFNTYIGAGMGSVVVQAFLLTTVAFGGLSIFAMNTKRDFSVMGKFLFIALIVVVVASLINIFVQSSIASLAISSVCAILFSAYILYDTQMIIRGGYDSPVLAAVALYLDILNLFVSLLNILGALNNNR